MNNLLKSPPLARVSKNESSAVQTFIKETVVYKPVSLKKKIGLQVFSSLGALEAILTSQEKLYKRESSQSNHPSSQYEKLEVLSDSYVKKINSLLLKVAETLSQMKEYLNNKNFCKHFPKSCKKIISEGGDFSPEETSSNFVHLNEITGVALQLQNCLIDEHTHRFIPHQLALLFRCLKQSKIEALAKYQARIEAAFEPVTAHISQGGGPLPKKHIEWLDDLVSNLVMEVYYSPSSRSLIPKNSSLQAFIVNLSTSS
ncbi:hypothetical protein DSO57_1002986 [Entomophthora muscae]|uniref:Uncharacterized protein n=1 Tax=Entomophthora muscae TaxID=34485 RepID=A0ACC2U783_9FUNG|nr:hypothetical protein DSO57_1002986 [Entomophthora muscae]